MIRFSTSLVVKLASRILAPASILVLVTVRSLAAESKLDELLAKAQTAFTNGQKAEAISLATQAIAAEPKSTQGYYLRGRFFETQKEHAKAIADFSQILKLDRTAADVYQRRLFHLCRR